MDERCTVSQVDYPLVAFVTETSTILQHHYSPLVCHNNVRIWSQTIKAGFSDNDMVRYPLQAFSAEGSCNI